MIDAITMIDTAMQYYDTSVFGSEGGPTSGERDVCRGVQEFSMSGTNEAQFDVQLRVFGLSVPRLSLPSRTTSRVVDHIRYVLPR